MILRQQGLGNAIKGTNAELEQRWGTTMLAPRSDTEFGEWRIHALLSKLRPVDYPTRLRLIREHLASVDMRTEHSVDTLGNLGSRLESAGMSREAVIVYRQLPDRAPSNPDYAQWLLRACENSGDVEPGASFAHHLLIAEAPNKPPAIGDEVLREKHALFLARDFNLDELRRQAFREKISQVLAGREPHEIPYLKAYALLQERMGNLQAALQAWQHLKAVFAANDQSGHEFEAEGNLHLAKLLQRLARPKEAVHALRAVPVKEPLSAMMTDTLDQRVRLAVGLGDWKEMGELKVQAVELKSLPTVLVIARELATHERRVEALNFLTQAERTLKDDHQRFTLRLEQLTLLSQDGAWSPERDRARLSALFRTPTRDRDTLVRLLEWLKKQSEGPHAAGWVRVLRAEAAAGSDRAAAALALSAFAPILDETTPAILHQAWAEAIEKDRLCIELTAQRLLEGQKSAWAREACRVVASIPTLRENGRKLPLTIRVAQALNDEAEVRELFNETLRMPFPGGGQTVAWALALEETGHANLARELFDAALRQIEAGESLQPEIHAAWTRFLIRQKDFDAAESFLMRMQWAMPGEAAKLVFELHAAWGKLSNLDAELPKYRLPTGTVREATFLAKQQLDQASPPP
jgi:tetratricopeptide (TPR) repeat protein